jgi:hypothetical protein
MRFANSQSLFMIVALKMIRAALVFRVACVADAVVSHAAFRLA